MRNGNQFIHFTPVGDNLFKHEYEQKDQIELDFIDFVFNKRSEDYFLYQLNDSTKPLYRELDKAILYYQGIPYLAPEIALLHVAKEYTVDDSEHDFTIGIAKMNDDQKMWLLHSLNLSYPEGHPWIDRLDIGHR